MANLDWDMKRYLGPAALTVISAVAAAVFAALLGDDWANGPHVWLAICLFFAGIVALLIQFRYAPLRQDGGEPADNWQRYQMPFAVTVASLLGIVLDDLVSGEAHPRQLLLGTLHILGLVILLIQLRRAPPPRSPRERFLKATALVLLAAPAVLLAAYIAVGIAREGDNAWIAAPLAIPGVVLAPYVLLALVRVLRAPPHQIG